MIIMMMMMMMMMIIIIIIVIIITTEHIYKLHENDKKRLYSSRVLQEEQGTFTPLHGAHYHWRHVWRISTLPQSTCWATGSQETGELRFHYRID